MPILIYITCPQREKARVLARKLVEEKLIACAHIFPMESIYWWKDVIEEHAEYVIIAKGMEKDFAMLTARVKDLHSYEVPCIVSVPITDGNTDYLTWIQTSTQK